MIGAALAGYAIGSLPLGYLAGRRLGGVDLRTVGSHNVGATNMYRVSGPRGGLLVMAMDVAKGAGAVALAWQWALSPLETVITAVAAVAGHAYPVWLKGRGGKGVATAGGAFALLAPSATAIAALIFVATAGMTRLVSAASIAATVALPALAALTGAPAVVSWGATAAAVLVVWRHRGNVVRLWRGTERRLTAREVPRA